MNIVINNASLALANQMRAMQQAAAGIPNVETATVTATDTPSFSDTLKTALDNTSAAGHHAGNMKKAFELGDPNVNIAQVMTAAQKSEVSFQSVVQVRNKLTSAYQEIFNMQV
jgi:flagellar hook-basal body complex protein FliE